jgi:hypothetical protein
MRSAVLLDVLSMIVGSAAVLLFQSGAYGHLLSSSYGSSAPAIYYAFWATAAITTGLIFIWRRGELLRMMPMAFAVVLTVFLTYLHQPIGAAGTSLIVSCSLIGLLVSVLSTSGSCLWVMRLSAGVVAFSSIFFIAEMYFPDGYSIVSGRSAGLFENPNLAGNAIVLGGTATLPFVSRKWRGAFAVLVLGGALATISRTSLLVLVVAIFAAMAIEVLVQRRKMYADSGSVVRAAVVAVACTVAFLFALQNSTVVAVSFNSSASTALTAVSAAADAHLSNSEGLTATELSDELGKTDSGAARIVLMENALHEATLWGAGVEAAHALSPHNLVLFYAAAFGVPGVLVLVLLLGSIVFLARENTVFCLALTGTIMFSHDLTMLEFAVPIALGCAGGFYLGARRKEALS